MTTKTLNELAYAFYDKSGGGGVTQAIPDFEHPTQIAAAWQNFDSINWAGGDFVTSVPGVNGQSIVALSGSPLTTGESVVVNVNQAVAQPCALELAASFVRTGISFATASLFANSDDSGLPDSVPSPINILSCYQSNAVQGAVYSAVAGTILHLVLETALPSAGTNQGVFIGDWVNVTGLVDTRLNYANGCINYISPDRKTIAIGFSDEAALPSLAVSTITPTLGDAKVQFYNNFSGARNAYGLRLTGTSATSAAVVSIFGGDDNQVSGTLLGDHRTTIATTAPNYVSGGNWGQYEIRANSRYLFDLTWGASVILDKAEQTQATWTARDFPRTSVKPASGSLLYPRFRLFKPVSMTRPVAKILNITKAGSTTWTVTHDGAYPFVTGNYVTIKGNRDVTNFAPITTPVSIIVLNSTQFTLIGVTGTATGYGGSVILSNGGRDQPGIIGQTIQSVVSRVADGANWLDVVGNTTWAGVSLGDYIDLHGVGDNTTGASLGLDGAWEVAHLATATMTLKPVFGISGARISPALGTLVSTNCSGSVILRPTLRSHDLMLSPRGGETVVQIDGMGTGRTDKAIPVTVLTMPSTTVSGTVSANTIENTFLAPSVYNLTTAASTNASLVKATAGTIYSYCFTNTTAAAAVLKIYNKASAPTVGTDIPVLSIPVAAGAFVTGEFGKTGKRFATGIAIAVTGLIASTDTTVVTAGGLVSIDYI